MLIRKFGIELKRISSDDIETIRLWRNKDFVRKNMHYTQPISASQQRAWFDSLNPKCNLYFIIIHQGYQVGLINLKEIDWHKREAEAGIFLGEENYLNTIIPILATIMLMDFSFGVIKLKSLKAKINRQNTEAIKFNKSIGYVYSEEIDGAFTYYTCARQVFLKATESFRPAINKFSNALPELTVTQEEVVLFGLELIDQNEFKVSIE